MFLYLSAELFTYSMGLDGTVYGAIGRLISEGMGTFWLPPHFDAGVPAFHDHPPLGLWIQGIWMDFLGTAFWVERLLGLMLLISISCLVISLWRQTTDHDGGAWILLLFFAMPVTTYVLKNNFLESFVVLITLAGVISAWVGRSRPTINSLVGLAAFAGFLIKGPVGLLPLTAPFIYALICDRRLNQAIVNSLIAGISFSLCLLLVLTNDDARTGLVQYFEQQVAASLSGLREIEHGRAYLAGQLLINLTPVAVASVLMWSWTRRLSHDRTFAAHLALSLIAFLPLLLSPRQYRHYLFPALPFFALSAGMLVRPRIPSLPQRWVAAAAIAVFLIAVTRVAMSFGTPGKDREILEDVDAIALHAVAAGEIGFCSPEPVIQTYLTRYHGLRSTTLSRSQGPWSQETVVCKAAPENYSLVLSLHDGWGIYRRAGN